MQLRDYQQRSIDQLYDWIRTNQGHPCLELPTGAGKSLIVAQLCIDAVKNWNGRVLMITASKELIRQNADKLRTMWPGAPLGIYSAGLRKRQLGEPITFAGIQSVRSRAAELGHQDLIIIDECHLINHEAAGSYRTLIDALLVINPNARVIGLTATPYRLGHGLITDEPAIFNDIIQPTSIEELVYKGFLSPLRSKLTGLKYDTSQVSKRGGDFIEKDLALAVDSDAQNDAVVRETIAIAGDRKAWLFFCSGVLHAVHMRDTLNAYGITAECITGDTPSGKRDEILRAYTNGEIRAVTNANVLTTGFDYPAIDLIALCRPTMSPALYVQMGGRGLRIDPNKVDCMVLDFAGVVARHGPITAVEPPDKTSSSGNGEAPTKVCEKCHEIVAAACRLCPTCGESFPEPEKANLTLHDDDIMQSETQEMEVESWHWIEWESKKSGLKMLRCDYYGKAFDDPQISEYLCLRHEGFAKKKAVAALKEICKHTGLELDSEDGLAAMVPLLANARPPEKLGYKKDGKFWRILGTTWPSGPPPEPMSMDDILEEDDIPF